MDFDKLFANSIGVIIAEIITLPICTIKTNYQTNNYKSIKSTILDINKKYGPKGFYEAKFSAIASQTISTSSKFFFYNTIKNYRNTKSNDLFNNAINGMTGGILGSIFSHPIDVIKIEQQRQKKFREIINNIKNDKLNYLYRGYSQSILKNLILYSSLYPIYDFYKTKIDNPLISAPLTTITITSYLQPIDYIKTNLMAGNKQINFNIKNLYKGTSLHLARSIPHFMITMYLTEYILNNFFYPKNERISQ
jgi:hypothetical protein